MKLRVLILGYGEMGHAFEHLLAGKHEVRIWSLLVPTNLEAETRHAQVILFCLPVNAHDEVLMRVAPHLQENSLCLSIAKGLNESGLPASSIFAGILGSQNHYGVIYGPMISEEIRRGRFSFADVALSNAEDYPLVHQLLSGSNLVCRPSRDMTGITWGVILKNVYAILFGIADGMQLGDNMRGHLAVTALAELSAIVKLMGGNETTPYGYSGLGDLITTATSADSHHHELGVKLAKGKAEEISGEGVHTMQMVQKYGTFDYQAFPLFLLVSRILRRPANVPELMQGYLQELPGHEAIYTEVRI